MKISTILLAVTLLLLTAGAAVAADSGSSMRDVEIGCGKCVYHMDGVTKCTVATKIGDEVMLLEGTDIDAHGLCDGPKRAKLYQPSVHATRVEILEATTVDAEIGCAKCVFHMDGVTGCTVAAKVGDTVMLVEGGGVDAHSLCSGSQPAKVTGTIGDGVLHATKVDLE